MVDVVLAFKIKLRLIYDQSIEDDGLRVVIEKCKSLCASGSSEDAVRRALIV